MSGQTIGGRYVLERRIGGGGMGAIWLARDAQLQRNVAVKLIAAKASVHAASAFRFFEQEAKAIAQLHHPNVVQVHDYGVDAGVPYIVMELLEGENLETLLERRGRLPPSTVAALLKPISRALAAAHAAGIVHRDLKPANLFLARVDGEEVVKVLDFGLARKMATPGQGDPGLTSGELAGTLRYMSPEQLRADPRVDARSDVWSLAVVTYRALTGQFPYNTDAVQALSRGAFRPPAVPVSTLVPELGAEADAFFARALHPDPEQRFGSARELAAAFATLVEVKPSTRTAKILVVDDEPDVELLMRQRLRRQLRESIYTLVFAANGEEALERLRQHPDTDVVLCDINMPRMDGLTFLSRVGEVSPLVKVVIVSAYSDMKNLRMAMNRGAFDFLVKPINFEDLTSTVAKAVQHVGELRRAVQSTEENQVLRMFVHGGILERVLPLVRAPDALAGERVEASIAFIDVHGFTNVTRNEAPEVVLRRLNANFEVIVPEVMVRAGMVERFIGDAVMAVFRGEGHLARALDACLVIRQQLHSLAFRCGDDSPYAHGVSIGLDSGPLVSGSVGAQESGRLDYTLLGDVVNTAARLASVAARDQILISDGTRRQVETDFECHSVGEQHLPGRVGTMVLHDVVGRRTQQVTASEPTASVAQPANSAPGSQERVPLAADSGE
ncbi:protein kinase [Pyxidicoccus fallax]|uniref:Protein kinase n=1 Tax=Pyxidicoccus fallax TaxID=394095 RepID=A0A848LZI6_9BACT|nr:protein kinase [Pyxidicoccus fallax]NMO22554.1 protein kinase [Pyxidicoccus fallax]NPC84530.1 protein kinase [Pyxidicoccus fallax]